MVSLPSKFISRFKERLQDSGPQHRSIPALIIFSILQQRSTNLPTSVTTIYCPITMSPPPPPPLDGVDLVASSSHRRTGEVHVILGPMFAGKTTALLRRVNAEAIAGRNVAMIKSSKDDRYAADAVVTHDGTKFPCWPLPDLSSFKLKFGVDAYKKLDVIGIDEAQFFDDLYDFCREAADVDGKIIVVAGLDGDYLRRSFGPVLSLVPLADTVTKLTARCEICGKRAFFTLRKTGETETELIGGADVYMPVCRRHYVSGQELGKEAVKPFLGSS